MVKTGSSILAFLFGAIVGAAVALLYAPMSGQELRSNIKTEADVRMEKLTAEWEKTRAELVANAEKTRAEIISYLDQVRAQVKEETLVEDITEE